MGGLLAIDMTVVEFCFFLGVQMLAFWEEGGSGGFLNRGTDCRWTVNVGIPVWVPSTTSDIPGWGWSVKTHPEVLIASLH
jgi:hypothetical protein